MTHLKLSAGARSHLASLAQTHNNLRNQLREEIYELQDEVLRAFEDDKQTFDRIRRCSIDEDWEGLPGNEVHPKMAQLRDTMYLRAKLGVCNF